MLSSLWDGAYKRTLAVNRKEYIFFNGYVTTDLIMAKEIMIGNPPLLLHLVIFVISSKGSFICTVPQRGRNE